MKALLMKARLAEAVPEACGEKMTLNEAVLPAAMVRGSEIPLTLNSELFPPIDETVTGALLALSVPVCEKVLPTVTLPKLMVAGLTASCPGATPEPVRVTEKLGFDAFETMERAPLALPADVGVKLTEKVKF